MAALDFETFRTVIAEQLQVDVAKVTAESNLATDLEADSLDLVELMMGLEERFGVQIPDDEAESITTVGDAWQVVQKRIPEATAS